MLLLPPRPATFSKEKSRHVSPPRSGRVFPHSLSLSLRTPPVRPSAASAASVRPLSTRSERHIRSPRIPSPATTPTRDFRAKSHPPPDASCTKVSPRHGFHGGPRGATHRPHATSPELGRPPALRRCLGVDDLGGLCPNRIGDVAVPFGDLASTRRRHVTSAREDVTRRAVRAVRGSVGPKEAGRPGAANGRQRVGGIVEVRKRGSNGKDSSLRALYQAC